MPECNRPTVQRFRRRPKKVKLLEFRNLPDNAHELMWFVVCIDPIPLLSEHLLLFSKVKLWVPVSPFCQHSFSDIGFLTPGRVYVGVKSFAEIHNLALTLSKFHESSNLLSEGHMDFTWFYILSNPDGSYYQLPYETLLNFQKASLPPATSLSLPLEGTGPGTRVDFHIGPFKGSPCQIKTTDSNYIYLQTSPLDRTFVIKLHINRAGLVAKVHHD